MGIYINPPRMSKEAWILEHKRQWAFAAPEQHRTADAVWVCHMGNGDFTAAGVCHSPEELTRFADPDDPRPKMWVLIPIAALIEVGAIEDASAIEEIDMAQVQGTEAIFHSHLSAFCREALTAIETGERPKWMREAGLCHNFDFYLVSKEVPAPLVVKLGQDFTRLFEQEYASCTFPFNSGSFSYYTEIFDGKVFSNPERLAFLHRHAAP